MFMIGLPLFRRQETSVFVFTFNHTELGIFDGPRTDLPLRHFVIGPYPDGLAVNQSSRDHQMGTRLYLPLGTLFTRRHDAFIVIVNSKGEVVFGLVAKLQSRFSGWMVDALCRNPRGQCEPKY